MAQLEAHTPVKEPTKQLELVAGDWRLLYTTIVISVSPHVLLEISPIHPPLPIVEVRRRGLRSP